MTERTLTEKALPWVALVIPLIGVIATAAVGQHRLGASETLIGENAKGIKQNQTNINTLFRNDIEAMSESQLERERMNRETGEKVLELELRQQTIIENQKRLEGGQKEILQILRQLD